ncbi:ATP-binding protein [Sorangium sp. So ce1128]
MTREKEEIYSRRVLPEVLPYTSPEQTGRMNRSLDYRADMYSLGVVLFELLTGRRPFEAMDPLELMHAHIAVEPVPPSEINPEVPDALSAITMKLLSKTAEDRYQCAEGLKADLEELRRRWRSSGQLGAFSPGQHDRRDLFRLHQKLYGRAGDIQTLIDSFDDVLRGKRTIVLVSGYSGIGKSSLVQEILKPLAREKGYYISGKYDQYNRDRPYSAIVHAFDALIKQLLSESEERIATWRGAILDALGSNGQVICDVVPSLKHILGEQPPVPALGPVEAQNRFVLYFQNFVSVFARHAHPLAIFLDDLQWVDSASLSLITSVLAKESVRSRATSIASWRSSGGGDSRAPGRIGALRARRRALLPPCWAARPRARSAACANGALPGRRALGGFSRRCVLGSVTSHDMKHRVGPPCSAPARRAAPPRAGDAASRLQ